MIESGESTVFIFVVDTDQYSGNFEREMTAFMTGQLGECDVGEEYAKMYRDAFKIHPDNDSHNDHILHLPDEHGCHRPATVCSTHGWFNDGDGNHYRDTDENTKIAADELMIDKKEELKDPGCHLDNVESIKAEIQEDIDRIKADGITKWPAYLSVGIPMDRYPTNDEVKRLIARAIEYVNSGMGTSELDKEPKIIIDGFRLIQRRTTEEISETWHISSKNKG